MTSRSLAAGALAAALVAACSSSNGNGPDAGPDGASMPDGSTDSSTAGGDASNGADAMVSPGNEASSDSSADGSSADAAACAAGTDFQTDSENCGRCGKSCLGADCVGGVCEAVLVMDAPQPNTFGDGRTDAYTGFVSGSNVYVWEESESGDHYDLLRAPTTPATPPSTGSPPLATIALPPFAGAVTFDSANAYTTFPPASSGATGAVMVEKLSDGSAPAQLFTLPAGDLDWSNIAVGADDIYLTGTTPFTSTAIYLIATPIADPTSMPAVIIDHLGEKITDLSVFANSTTGLNQLVWLDYLSTRPDSDAGPGSDWFVYTAPATAGATPVLLDDASTSTASIASDGTYVYWTEANDAGALMRCPMANLDRAHVQHVADVASAQEGIVMQGRYAWVMELSDPGPIFRIDTGTGDKELVGNRTVGASVKNSYLFGIDSTFIYMAGIDGPVYRLPSMP